ncbi:MAG: tRNA dihydrouridine synthase DusB [Desulfopila sp.]
MHSISGVKLSSPLILAPLAGYSDLPFRILCREFGAGLCVSEMISCHGLVHGQIKTRQMLASDILEHPVSFQLFGAEVSPMAKAADILNEFHADIIDINMGCPVKKVTKKGAGAALMAQPRLAAEILREVVKNSRRPVTVKFRSGVNAHSNTCVDFAKMAEQAGAAAVTVHGRHWAQNFTGLADWRNVAAVKQSVAIPVIGNGDITSFSQAQRHLRAYQCDAIMIGRAALGNPWVFSTRGRPHNHRDILLGAARHLQLMESYYNVDKLLAVVKNHIGRYFKHLDGSSALRRRVYECTTFTALQAYFDTLLQHPTSSVLQ